MNRKSPFGSVRWAMSVPPVLLGNGRVDGDAMHVLLVLATFADADGSSARPGVALLAKRSYRSPEAARGALERLATAGLIEASADLNGTTEWRLRVEVVAHGRTVLDERDERRRAANAERQRRHREKRAAARNGSEDRDVTGGKGVTRNADPARYVTGGSNASNGSEGRYVTGGSPLQQQVSTPIPATNQPKTSHKNKNTSAKKPADDAREDVEQLCARLLERVIANDFRATITAKWRTDARLLLDRDGRSLDQALRLIDWATSHTFWAPNIRSMPKFREQYDQLLGQARREHQQAQRSTGPRTADDKIRDLQALKTGTTGAAPAVAAPSLYALPRGGSQ